MQLQLLRLRRCRATGLEECRDKNGFIPPHLNALDRARIDADAQLFAGFMAEQVRWPLSESETIRGCKKVLSRVASILMTFPEWLKDKRRLGGWCQGS